jgi:ABC-type lipoprotein export system ATPase subunit
MGPSGCGKSTLLNLVAGLDVADEGTITVAGELVTGRTEDELSQLRRKHIGIVFQFFNLLEGMTVLENVALPAVIAGRKRKMAENGPATCSTCSASATRRRRSRGCSRVASASGSPSPAPWPTSRPCCWPTSRPARSTPRVGRRSSSC